MKYKKREKRMSMKEKNKNPITKIKFRHIHTYLDGKNVNLA